MIPELGQVALIIALAVVMQRELAQGAEQAGSTAPDDRRARGVPQPRFREFVVRDERGQ